MGGVMRAAARVEGKLTPHALKIFRIDEFRNPKREVKANG
jgi:hypothetical protein